VVGIAFSVWSGQLWAINNLWGSFAAAVGGGFASSVIATGSLKAGLWGAVSAAAFWGIGTAFSKVAYGPNPNGATSMMRYSTGSSAAKIAAHAGAGGVLAELQGGKFGSAFFAAGVTEWLSPAVSSIGMGDGQRSFVDLTAQTVAAATIGGTASAVTGNGFGSGAQTAAFQFLFNQVVHSGAAPEDDLAGCDETCEYRRMRGGQDATRAEAAQALSSIGDIMEETYYTAVLGWAARAGIAVRSMALTTEVAGLGTGYRSFSAFKRAHGLAGPDKAWHHIVEQNPANMASFGPYMLHNTGNLTKLSTAAHINVGRVYGSIRFDITGSATLTVRQWISAQSFQQQLAFGNRVVENVSRGIWP